MFADLIAAVRSPFKQHLRQKPFISAEREEACPGHAIFHLLCPSRAWGLPGPLRTPTQPLSTREGIPAYSQMLAENPASSRTLGMGSGRLPGGEEI